jgi:hypothetical protein
MGKGRGIPKFAHKRDGNEKEIRQALEAIGAQVYPLSVKGLPDLLVNYHGKSFFMEVKAKKGQLTEAQVAVHETWEGDSLLVVHDADEALAALDAKVTA